MGIAMGKDWQTILRFAALGFAFAVLAAGYEVASNSAHLDVSVDAVLLLVCPAELLLAPLFAWFFEAAEVGTTGFYFLWFLAALVNAAIYAIIGATYVGLRNKPDGNTTT
jgi:hypothetical protein